MDGISEGSMNSKTEIIETHLSPSSFQDLQTLDDLLKKYQAADLTSIMQQALDEGQAATAAQDAAIAAYDGLVKRTNELQDELRTLTAQDHEATAVDCAALLAGQDVDASAYALRKTRIGLLNKTIEHAREIALPDATSAKLQAEAGYFYAAAIGTGWACIAAGVARNKALAAAAAELGEQAFSGPAGKTYELLKTTQRYFSLYGKLAGELDDYRKRQQALRQKIKEYQQ
jgi:hypothetical protein